MPSRNSAVILLPLVLAACINGGPPMAGGPHAPVVATAPDEPITDAGGALQLPDATDITDVASASSSESALRYDQVGYASWYGEEMGGAATASGAPFDAGAITAAHRTVPLGATIEVTALDTGRNILALVNDRGPSRVDRIVDLSRGAAQALGIDAGAPVRVRVVTPSGPDLVALSAGRPAATRLAAPPVVLAALRRELPATGRMPPRVAVRPAPLPSAGPALPPTARPDGYVVQVAAFAGADRARALARVLGGTVHPAGSLYRVWLGPYRDAAAAQAARDGAAVRGYGDARIIAPQ